MGCKRRRQENSRSIKPRALQSGTVARTNAVPNSLLLDHIAIGARTLGDGVRRFKECLNVEIPFGGTHSRMGTHNCLTKMDGDSSLEIIAVDPEAPPPGRPRWFDLDDANQRCSMSRGPRPVAWIARTRNIEAVLGRAQGAGLDLGRPVEMTRGDLRWLIAIRDDGHLPEGGALPVIIQWPDGPHPARRMTDLGVRLHALHLHHPSPETLRAKLEIIGAADIADVAVSETGAPAIECDLAARDARTQCR